MSSVAGSFRESLESIAGTIGDVIIIVIIIAVIAFVVKLAGGIQGLFGGTPSTTTSTPGAPQTGGGPGQTVNTGSPGIVPSSIVEYLPGQSVWAQGIGPNAQLIAVPAYGTITTAYNALGQQYNPQVYPSTWKPPPYPVFAPPTTQQLPFTQIARNYLSRYATPPPTAQVVYTPINTPSGLQLNSTIVPVSQIYPVGTPGRL